MASHDSVLVSAPRIRLRQGLRALLTRTAPVAIPDHQRARLPAGVVAAWARLSPYDQHHLVAVAADLEAAGHPDHIVAAGLLHDIGKAGGVTVVDRVALVVIGRLAPDLRDRLAARPRPLPGLEGLHLLLRHAEQGALLLANAGMPADVIWLVRHHDRDTDHADLRALRVADHRN